MTTKPIAPISSAATSAPIVSASRWGIRSVALLGLFALGAYLIHRYFFSGNSAPAKPDIPPAPLSQRFLEALFPEEPLAQLPYENHAAGIFRLTLHEVRSTHSLEPLMIECQYQGQTCSRQQMSLRAVNGSVWEGLLPDMPFGEEIDVVVYWGDKEIYRNSITPVTAIGVYELMDGGVKSHPHSNFRIQTRIDCYQPADSTLAIQLLPTGLIQLFLITRPVTREEYIQIQNLSGKVHILFFEMIRNTSIPQESYRVPVVVMDKTLNLPEGFLRKGWENAYRQAHPNEHTSLEGLRLDLLRIEDAGQL